VGRDYLGLAPLCLVVMNADRTGAIAATLADTVPGTLLRRTSWRSE
jgi:hypothetical protein